MKRNYEINATEKQFLENLPIPLVIYEIHDNNQRPLVVTDGVLKLFGKDRQALLYYLENNLLSDINAENSKKLEDFIKFGKEFNDVFSINSNKMELNVVGEIQKKNDVELGFVTLGNKNESINNVSGEKEEVKALNNRLNMIIDNLPEGITVYECKDSINLIPIRISNAFSIMMGKTYEESLESLKKDAFADMHPDDAKLMKRILFKTDKSKEYKLDKIVRYYNKELGRYKYIQLACLGIPDYDGKFNVIISHIDVDEKYRTELELKRAQKNLGIAIKHGGMEYIEWDIKNNIGYKTLENSNFKVVLENFTETVKNEKLIHKEDIEKI